MLAAQNFQTNSSSWATAAVAWSWEASKPWLPERNLVHWFESVKGNPPKEALLDLQAVPQEIERLGERERERRQNGAGPWEPSQNPLLVSLCGKPTQTWDGVFLFFCCERIRNWQQGTLASSTIHKGAAQRRERDTETERREERRRERERERERYIYICIYICCGVIIWAKFGLLRCYYLGQVCFFTKHCLSKNTIK